MRLPSLLLYALPAALLAACSSSDTTSSGDGGSGGCTGDFSCFCGSPACVEGRWVCPSCGGDSGGDASSFACGSITCGPNQLCVHDCCGGAPTDGGSCTPPPPTCLDIPAACGDT